MTPIVFDKALWKQSGHYDHYKEDMFFLAPEGCGDGATPQAHGHREDCAADAGHRERGLKPMNCPGHCLVFANTQVKRHAPLFTKVSTDMLLFVQMSYNDLPLRLADFSPLHRNEATGALSGLTRLRQVGLFFCLQ